MAFDSMIKVATNLSNTKSPEKASKLPEQLICPQVTRSNPGEMVAISTVESVKGLVNLPIQGVLGIASGPLLKLLLDNADLFGVKPVVLTGYPDAEYTPEFDQQTWSCDKVSYDELVAELVTTDRISGARNTQAGSRKKDDREERSLTAPRKKHYDGFEKFEVEEASDDSGA